MRVKVQQEDGLEAKVASSPGSRSPAYPAFDLREAVTKLGLFFDKCRKHPASLEATYLALGYSSAHGAAKRSVGALRAYGLLEPAPGKDQELRISPLGLVIVNHLEDDPERHEAIRTAAQRPKIFRELLDTFGTDIPHDNLLHSFLVKKGFSREAVPNVIAPFRSTFEFAKLGVEGKMEDEDNEDDAEELEAERARQAEAERKRREAEAKEKAAMNGAGPFVPTGMEAMPVPLGIGRQMILHFPKDVTEDDLDFFNTFWEAYQKRLKKSIGQFISEKMYADE